jgi:hypothetical protein
VAAILSFLPAPPAGADWCARHVVCVKRVASKHCSNRRPVECIRYAALRYHQSFSRMRGVAWRESRFNPGAWNSIAVGARGEHASGLMQFLPSTFASTPFRRHSLWYARWSALAAGWMWAHGRAGEWSTY